MNLKAYIVEVKYHIIEGKEMIIQADSIADARRKAKAQMKDYDLYSTEVRGTNLRGTAWDISGGGEKPILHRKCFWCEQPLPSGGGA